MVSLIVSSIIKQKLSTESYVVFALHLLNSQKDLSPQVMINVSGVKNSTEIKCNKCIKCIHLHK
jgi:hypothetical protein